ncbi:phospholipase D family protein [Agarivorans sp. 1_MG-2023]|uniref:phospholipase D family protein n=1 Tax=Agarivorans sp. 1_MG-2023 TaxID=3062634 RepID=UPI0026E4955C|nr:phospholipase D family protein [Agarivorans sp. 1_MG-2023]MDO6762153.1 phospholipase D family protein [Agarivorans sp. 1_MG-2023]
MDLLIQVKRIVVILFVSQALLACAQRPSNELIEQHKQASYTLTLPQDSINQLKIDHITQYQPGKTGIAILADGISAFAARIALIEQAEQSIDAQYYMIKEDMTGAIFLGNLLKAADRGVRVRLLIDDINTSNYDDVLKALSLHHNIEVRIFNPFYDRTFRGTNMVGDFNRLNSRMHNKSLTIDGVITVVGGRNIGDEYFSAKAELEFADLDAIALGPVVKEVSQAFDLYWNGFRAYPIEALNPHDIDQQSQYRRLEQQIFKNSVKSFIVAHQRYQQLLANQDFRDHLYWCDGRLLVDHPGKDPAYPSDVSSNLGVALSKAEQSIMLSSPYFVPGEEGTKGLLALANKGIDVSVITNSLAATDVAAVHSGYKKYRKRLVEGNVFLYEVKPDAKQKERLAFFGKGASRASLHSKMFIIDEEKLFIGSFNWDPRSINLNTEMGLLLTCPNLAELIHRSVYEELPYKSYLLALDQQQDLEWIEKRREQEEIRYNKEPKASAWRKFQAWIVGLLPLEDQL